MKRILAIIVVVLMCIGFVACGDGDMPSMFDEKTQADEKEDESTEKPMGEPTDQSAEKPTEQPTEKTTEKQTEQPTEDPASDIPEGADLFAILFMSPKIDMFITMKMPEWTYSTEMIPGQVFFFPQDDLSGETGVSISSDATTTDTSIEEMWEVIAANFEEAMPGFEWERAEDVQVGEYTAGRYSFVTDWFHGDYFYWNTEGRFYTCSFTAREAEYDELAGKLLESLETFQVLSDMQG